MSDGVDQSETEIDRVRDILRGQFGDAVFTVEDDVVWVSGINAKCASVARRMARELSYGYDIPTSLTHDDDADRFGGVQFNWGESA